MRSVLALVFCGVVLAGHAWADPLADLQAANDAFKEGDLTTAEVLLSDVIDSGKLDSAPNLLAEALNRRCIVRIKAEQYEAAAADCERAIELDPSYSSAHLNLGSIHSLGMEYEAAVAEFSLALQHGKLPEKDIAMAYSNRGWAYFFQQDYQSALKDFDSALAEDPRYEAALHGRSSSYIEIGELDKAMAAVEAALRAYPNSPQPIINRGLVRMYRGQLDDAVADFDKFIEMAPENSGGYFNRALVMFLRSDWSATIADIDRMLLVQDDVPSALWLRGLARQKLGQNDLARQDFDRARFVDPTVESAVEHVLRKLQPQ